MQSVLLVSDGQGSKHLNYVLCYVAFLPVSAEVHTALQCTAYWPVWLSIYSVCGIPGFLYKFGQLCLASGYLSTHARLFYGGIYR